MRGTIRKRGKRFQAIADIRDAKGIRQRPGRTFLTRREAAAWLAEVQTRTLQGFQADPGRMKLGEYLAQWLEGLKLDVRPSTWGWYETTIRVHIAPGLGDARLTGLTPESVKAFYSRLTPSTARRVHVALRKALGDAARTGLLVRNPVAFVKKPKAQLTRPPIWWSVDELTEFLERAELDRFFAAWRLIAMTGLRRGEALGLYWSDFDWTNSSLTVRRSYGVKGLSEPKTPSSYRTIDLDPETVAILREHRKRQMEEQLAAGPAWQPGEFVFTKEDGRPLDPRNLSKAFASLVGAAGLRRIRLHELRDTHGSQLVIAGVHPKVVQERLGHSSMDVTLGLYAHVMPSLGKDAAQVAANLVTKLSPKTSRNKQEQ